jgi:hypothetical protein
MEAYHGREDDCRLHTHFRRRLHLFVVIWIFLGLLALFQSAACLMRGGTLYQKMTGILLAVFFGPLFFVIQPAMGLVDPAKGPYCS